MVSGIKIRPPAVAGSFYPAEKVKLKSLLKNFYAKTKLLSSSGKVKALIVPHAGYIYSGQTAAWGFVQLPKDSPDPHFVLIGPSHHFYLDKLASPMSNFWQTPLGNVKQAPGKSISAQILFSDQPHVPEHSLEVQLPFLQYLFGDNFSFSAFLTGNQINLEKSAKYFLQYYPGATFIISSDLSHYLPKEEAERRDKMTVEAILKQTANYCLVNDNTACGAMGIAILLTMAKKQGWKSKLIYYDTSATTSGDETAVVGYASIGFYE